MRKQQLGSAVWLIGLVIVIAIGFGLRKSIDWLESTVSIPSAVLEIAGWALLILSIVFLYRIANYFFSKGLKQ